MKVNNKKISLSVVLVNMTTLFFAFSIVNVGHSASVSEVEKSIKNNIVATQKKLNKKEKIISKERSSYASKIHKQQLILEKLRKETAVARRLVDEQTLGLSDLEKRVTEWRNQSIYQKQLISSYAGESGLSLEEMKEVSEDFGAGLHFLRKAIDAIEPRLYPVWKESKIVLNNGELRSAKSLQVGPVNWYLDEKTNSAGLLDINDNGIAKAVYTFGGKNTRALKSLYSTGKGDIAFDPTMGRLIQVNSQSDSVATHLAKGGIWAYPILFFALLALCIAVFKAIQLFQLPKIQAMFATRLEMLVKTDKLNIKDEIQKMYQSSEGHQKQLIGIAIDTKDPNVRDDLLVAFLMESKEKLERFIGVISITAAIAPLLGLLGTVTGMIETFKMMTVFGGGDPAVVSGGISEALVTTELGLIVAIPAIVLSALLSKKIKSYHHDLETMAIKISKVNF